MIALVPTFMVGDVHCTVALYVADHPVYFENKNAHQFKNLPKNISYECNLYVHIIRLKCALGIFDGILLWL